MKKNKICAGVLAGASCLMALHSTHAAVSLNFTDNDLTPTSTAAAPGTVFPFSVKFTTSGNSNVSGADYQVHASTNGVFEFLSRQSNVSGSSFTAPSGSSDAALSPVILNPNNGTDLGTSSTSGQSVFAPGTYELADFSFEILPGTPAGVYTLSFLNPSYAGEAPSFPKGTFASLGTFTVSVPEPASVSLFAIVGVGLGLRPRRRHVAVAQAI